MLIYLLALVGGILTIVSPCILPVLPFVFSRADQPFRRSGLPLLAGMAITFAVVASVATVAGAWIVRANQIGRALALIVFLVVGLALIFPLIAESLSRPFVRLGERVQRKAEAAPSVAQSVLLGVATGLLWAPCAGPILGLILTGAAVQGASAQTAILLLAFALGAALSMGLALLAGNKVFMLMKRSLGMEEWIRRGLGAAVLLGVIAIAFGWDQGILRRVSLASTSGVEQNLVDRLHPVTKPSGANAPAMSADPAQAQPSMTMMAAKNAQAPLPVEGTLPSLDGAVAWLNSSSLGPKDLKGKVVLIDFWTYSCINCLRSIPYIEAWAEKYKADGLVVIGVHTPEFAFEKDQTNVARAVRELKITYPVAIDSNYAIWKAFNNQYWPAHYFIDRQGKIRYHHFGEGEYDQSERVIRQLLKEGNTPLAVTALVEVNGVGAQAAADFDDVRSPETYIGYERRQNFVSPEALKKDSATTYTSPGRLDVNEWALAGKWKVSDERADLVATPGKIVFRFHARDLHLVLGPAKGNKPVRFRILLDGAPPAEDHGTDVDAQGDGTVKEYRLYQLIRQKGKIENRTFQIEFLDPGVQAFAFTFG